MSKGKNFDDTVSAVTKELTDQGKLIAAGFAMLRARYLKDASPQQIDDMEFAFMAGAQHVFGSIMSLLDPGDDPTEDDMRRLDLINDEMSHWCKIFAARGTPIKGNA